MLQRADGNALALRPEGAVFKVPGLRELRDKLRARGDPGSGTDEAMTAAIGTTMDLLARAVGDNLIPSLRRQVNHDLARLQNMRNLRHPGYLPQPEIDLYLAVFSYAQQQAEQLAWRHDRVDVLEGLS